MNTNSYRPLYSHCCSRGVYPMTTTSGTIGRGTRASIQNTGIPGQDQQATRSRPRSLRKEPAERPVTHEGALLARIEGRGPGYGGLLAGKVSGMRSQKLFVNFRQPPSEVLGPGFLAAIGNELPPTFLDGLASLSVSLALVALSFLFGLGQYPWIPPLGSD